MDIEIKILLAYGITFYSGAFAFFIWYFFLIARDAIRERRRYKNYIKKMEAQGYTYKLIKGVNTFTIEKTYDHTTQN